MSRLVELKGNFGNKPVIKQALPADFPEFIENERVGCSGADHAACVGGLADRQERARGGDIADFNEHALRGTSAFEADFHGFARIERYKIAERGIWKGEDRDLLAVAAFDGAR